MSTKTKTATVLSQAETESTALPRVRKPGLVPIMSWAVPLEGSALEQATNLSNLPFAIDHVALMPEAHTGYEARTASPVVAEHPEVLRAR